MKNNKIKSFMLLHILLFFYSFCGVFSKLAANNGFLSIKFCLFYGISILILGIYAILWQQILKKFTLTTAFFNKAITVVWGIIWGALFFGEKIKFTMIIGAIIIILGVYFVVISDE